MSTCRFLLGVAAFGLTFTILRAEEAPRKPEEVAASARRSVGVLKVQGRRDEAHGEGTGFLLAGSGYLVTNYHVVGEGRRFLVELHGGARLEPRALVAFDRARDLAILDVGAKDLPGLELGDSTRAEPGQPVVAVGNPLGLGLSAISGSIAASREFDGKPFLQIALPIEPGSSGSPVLGLDGRVLGVLAIKSGPSTALAIPSAEVTALLRDPPRPIPFERWLTIGTLDPSSWRPVLGGTWRQRAGRIVASGTGEGFGGRTLCLSELAPADASFDLSVEVKLEDESGAAGLAFHADGGDRHYGFYPTNGSLRLTRFDGPDVFTWTILRTVDSAHYRPGEWNTIGVSVREARITCRVNGEEVIALEDDGLRGGKVGLVKFRAPGAQFRHFELAREITSNPSAPATLERALDLARKLGSGELPEREAVAQAQELGPQGLRALLDRAKALEGESRRLRAVGEEARVQLVITRLAQEVSRPDAQVDLLRAALLVSQLDNEDIDLEAYQLLVDRMGREAAARVAGASDEKEKLERFLRHVFEDLSFRGSRSEYHSRSNSYLNEVLDDREGMPITLAVVLLELGRRAGVPLVGIGAPGHFLVEHRPENGPTRLIDPFAGGKLVTRTEAESLSGARLEDSDLAPATKRQIVERILNNLFTSARSEGDLASMERYIGGLVLLGEDPAEVGPRRWVRATLRFQLGRLDACREDVDWLLGHDPPGVSRPSVEELSDLLRRRS